MPIWGGRSRRSLLRQAPRLPMTEQIMTGAQVPAHNGIKLIRALPLGLRMLAREWRSGELGVLLLALIVAVGALTGVGFLVSRISTAVALQVIALLSARMRFAVP